MSSINKIGNITPENSISLFTRCKIDLKEDAPFALLKDLVINLEAVVNESEAYIFMKDTTGRYVYVNKNVQNLFGTLAENIVGRDDSHFFNLEVSSELRVNDRHVINDGETIEQEETNIIKSSGEKRIYWTIKKPVFNKKNQIIGLFGISTDITEQKQEEYTLAESRKLLSTIIDAVPESIFWKDIKLNFLGCNVAFSKDAGVALPGNIIGKNDYDLWLSKEQADAYRNDDQQVIDSGVPRLNYEEPMDTLGGKWLQTSKVPLRDNDNKIIGVLGIYRDITDKKRQDELVISQANYDDLTQLPNRNLFQYQLNKEIKKSRRNGSLLSLMFLDLDHFKDINDTLGHAAGDKLLKMVSRRIIKCVRETDTVARLGGDEFAVILSDINSIRNDIIAQNIIETMNKAFRINQDKVEHYISTSIGIVLYPDDGENIESLMKHADQAMYKAKSEGRNRFCYFTRSMQQEAHEKMTLTHSLRQALRRNELQVYYQPIIDLSNKNIFKAETLLRWKHPELGLVDPAVFIPLAEGNGLIQEIGEWVFEQACLRIGQWFKKFGYIVQLSVNVSPVQFKNSNKQPWYEKLSQLGLPGNSINVEITEGSLLKDSSHVKDRLLQYRNTGIEVSIDDFGTGFSSLSYLQKFDIDYLKIDRAFIRNLLTNDTDRALVEAIIVMAHKLGINTIAEGVETKEQQDMLIQFNCDYVQGFYYSHAIPAEEFEKLLVQKLKLD
tara:strand:- start:907 stop:3075 length:2169 start_codon:yes stop_codon:yes gene_type:complete